MHFLVLSGPTASGKTSLLHAILGEMQLVVGDPDSSPDAAAADSTAEEQGVAI